MTEQPSRDLEAHRLQHARTMLQRVSTILDHIEAAALVHGPDAGRFGELSRIEELLMDICIEHD